jgi:hypothetical protein
MLIRDKGLLSISLTTIIEIGMRRIIIMRLRLLLILSTALIFFFLDWCCYMLLLSLLSLMSLLSHLIEIETTSTPSTLVYEDHHETLTLSIALVIW